MVSLTVQAGGVASAAARVLLERKNQTDWSNRQLAESVGWSRNTIDRYLHGERVIPLDVPGQDVGVSRLIGGWPLRAEWRRRVL